MTDQQTWTIGRLLTWTTDYLRNHGSDSPRLDAEVLLAHARGCQRIELYTAFDEEAGEEVRVAFREMVRRRAEAAPVAYLVGGKEFFSLHFRVSEDVLIPRPETELLVVSLLDKAKALSSTAETLHIADVGTGSGVLAVCAAKHLPSAQVKAIDISPAALEIARKNANLHNVNDRIEFIEGDLLTALPAEPAFDFIVSNPPYIGDGEFDALPDDVRLHEPRIALTSGPTGTEIIEQLIPQAAERLKPGGWLMIEISPIIATAVQQLFANGPRFETAAIVKDHAQHPRVITARRAAD